MKKREGEWLVFRTSEGKKRIKPWDANFGYFGDNNAEIFRDTEQDLELKPEKLVTQGVNIAITFSRARCNDPLS